MAAWCTTFPTAEPTQFLLLAIWYEFALVMMTVQNLLYEYQRPNVTPYLSLSKWVHNVIYIKAP